MLKKDRWRLIIVAVVVLAALLSVFPIRGRVRLGLDLKGGAHILLQAKGTSENPLTDDSVERLLAVLRNRIDQYGVSEPVIQREGVDRIIVDLPGVADPEAALELIGKTALLEFKHVHESTGSLPPGPQRANYDSQEEFMEAQARWDAVKRQFDEAAEEMRVRAESDPEMTMSRSDDGEAYLLGKTYVSGGDLVDAKTDFDNLGRPVVTLQFTIRAPECSMRPLPSMWAGS